VKDRALKSGPDEGASNGTVRRRMILTGVLQGIGFRPTVYRLATKLGLAGWVINSTNGVRIEIEGTLRQCRHFEKDLPDAIPFPGRIDSASIQEIEPQGERVFRIEASLEEKRLVTPIPPDVAACPECVQELFDPENHRYLYPFITCTLCGPRFTVVRAFPYDRERTSMADFEMCPSCRREYESPHDRRFHSQTNSCPSCGPRLSIVDTMGNELDGDPVLEAIRLLNQGKVVAVKGIGGFHLACNALREDAVQLLRDRKGREEKPFAVMMADMETVRRYCRVSREEEELLSSPVAPIVLLPALGNRVAPNVAPFMGTLGVMLPYSPVHHLLFKHPELSPEQRPHVLVMTSGNRSEEPIARSNTEAIKRLGELADAFLMHDRQIVLAADDSIFRVIGGRPTAFRRSRGLVPGEFKIEGSRWSGAAPTDSTEPRGCDRGGRDDSRGYPVVMGAGGDLKNALAVIKGNQAVPGPHVGDLASPIAQDYFRQSVSVLTGYLETHPEVIAVDPHPEYFSSNLAREMRIPVEEVFHHQAHAVSLLFEHGLEGPALFAVFDGTGYGTDGTIWGGEFLVADLESFHREAHVGLFALPGGEAAIKEPVRILAGLLGAAGTFQEEFVPLTGGSRDRVNLWLEVAAKGMNSPLTSSVGRLFDAAAAAIGFRRRVTFEGEAAMWLEGIADPTELGEYPVRLRHGDLPVIDPEALILAVAQDMINNVRPERVAARFHNSIARMVLVIAEEVSGRIDMSTVGLTGGCFQNKLLTERTEALLKERGFRVLLHQSVPPNDGGIALGQAVCVRSRFATRRGIHSS
jgi:hydrogenase maturation protein HypF